MGSSAANVWRNLYRSYFHDRVHERVILARTIAYLEDAQPQQDTRQRDGGIANRGLAPSVAYDKRLTWNHVASRCPRADLTLPNGLWHTN